ncbi:MAG: NTP transferase domain-containing protein [Firmicutes bacterium]|nr:NTP transferase domain-containing protein [Bacillota bacterium]
MHAIVLAGQPNHGLLKVHSSAAYESEIVVAGRRMADWVLDALEEAPSVSSIGLVGPESLRREGVVMGAMTGTLFGNIVAGLKTAPAHAEMVLFVTSDIPWITADIVEAFLRSAPRDRDVVYPVIPKSEVLARFGSSKRTYVRLKEGVFTGGNIFLARVDAVPQLKAQAERLIAHRKSPWKLAQDVGWGLLARFVTGRLSLDDVETRVGGVLGITGRALIFPYAEAGVDVDKPEDLRLAELELSRSRREVQGWDIS